MNIFRNDFSFISLSLLLPTLPLVMSYDMNNKSEMEKAALGVRCGRG
jgi:hypothetical protein